ncbi:carbohydrate ABC transporter substrate-binding protein, CUT1 family [Actinopolyspora xinjiangensis]|uniref:Carbohydrate ABC transporter substrate-binding protein, CUT1 family n=1 Tax=Actinopolyspora xinjiangensis TaxID=405564 RepID=A0A1H0RNE8_9ACTN|nr:extracellular solute-binding protein [Actinopolyspora xinjiangensis]SDP31004.1 carbohydrate ABC transporter substrate-binding protein, CUT1 family [Actinopolyspora xinjiangensis]
MRHRRLSGVIVLILVLMSSLLAGCAREQDDGRTLTYWASNQGNSPQQDRRILNEEFEKFTARTGIEVNVEVIGWGDLLNKILGSAVSGVGPDVVNLGNTWAASLQATGAFVPFTEERMRQLGGRERFLETSMSSTGMPGRPPSSVPLYGLSYGVFYNKAMFREAGIEQPPSNWSEFVDVARRLTRPSQEQWGMTLAGASYTENAHFAFMLGNQEGAQLFDSDGRATFASPPMVTGVQRYVELMSEYEVVNPDDAEIGSATEAVGNFANGEAGMLVAQNSAIAAIRAAGMADSQWGVFPLPVPEPMPEGGEAVRSHVAGTNIAVYRNSDNKEAAVELVEFLTSAEEQSILNEKYGSLPVVTDAYDNPAFDTKALRTFSSVLAESSKRVPMIPNENRFETTVGAAVRDLFARAGTDRSVSRSDIADALDEAQQKMRSGGGSTR